VFRAYRTRLYGLYEEAMLMHLFISRSTQARRGLRRVIPVFFSAGALLLFCLIINVVSEQSLAGQKESLERALRQSAVRTYALTGAYPESLDELLSIGHITYSPEHFLVEYVPTGSNLFPSIFVFLRENHEP